MKNNLGTYLFKSYRIFFRKSVVIITILSGINLHGQVAPCELLRSQYHNINIVDKDDFICISKNTTKNKTLIYTFAIWCKPCIVSLPEAIKLADDYNLDLYVLLIEKESDKRVKQAVDYLKDLRKDINYLVLKDAKYGLKSRAKYKKFLLEITPKEFENIDCLSKYILIDKNGKVIMVTNWKDIYFDGIKDETKMIQKKIVPLLEDVK